MYTEKHQLDQRPINLMTSSLRPAARRAHAPPIRSECAEYLVGSAPHASAARLIVLATMDLLISFLCPIDVK